MCAKSGRTVTLGDVAAAAGVSPATVSMVINNRARVAATTAERVWKSISELNYTPKNVQRRQARSEGGRVSGCVALLAAGVPRAVLASPVYSELVQGVETEARARNLELLLRHLPDLKQPMLPLTAAGLRGAIIFGPMEHDHLLYRVVGDLTCVAVLGRIRPGSNWDQVTVANQTIGPLAADYLFERGHKHFAFLGSSGGATEPRREGYVRTVESRGGQVLELMGELVEKNDQRHVVDFDLLKRLLDQLMRQQPRPTGLFVATDMLTRALYSLLYQVGLTPGRDLDIVSCNNERALLDDLQPPPAEIDIHAMEIGRLAVERLLWRMENRHRPRAVIQVDPVLLPPRTHGSAPPKAASSPGET